MVVVLNIGRGVQESWVIFQHHFLQAQDTSPGGRNQVKEMSKELLSKLGWKKGVNVIPAPRDSWSKGRLALG